MCGSVESINLIENPDQPNIITLMIRTKTGKEHTEIYEGSQADEESTKQEQGLLDHVSFQTVGPTPPPNFGLLTTQEYLDRNS